jgi:transposase
MQTDYAGHTIEVIDPKTGEIRQAQIFVAVLGASSLTFAMASFTQRLPDWIEGQTRALAYFGGVPKAIVCDNLKAGVAKALWFEPTLNQTFAAMAEHYDTTILPTRSRKPRDKGKVEGAVLIVERWILARLRHVRFFSLADLNAAIGMLLEELNNRPMRRLENPADSYSRRSNVRRWGRCRACHSNTPSGNPPRCIPTITSRSTRPSTRYRTV